MRMYVRVRKARLYIILSHGKRLLVLRREDVFRPFLRQKNVHEKVSLYAVPFCHEMPACDCSCVQRGLHWVMKLSAH